MQVMKNIAGVVYAIKNCFQISLINLLLNVDKVDFLLFLYLINNLIHSKFSCLSLSGLTR